MSEAIRNRVRELIEVYPHVTLDNCELLIYDFVLSEIARAQREGQSGESVLYLLLQVLDRLTENKHHQREFETKIMSALSDLQAAVAQVGTDLAADTSAVTAAIAHIGSPAATDAQLVPLTAALGSASATLQANTKALNDAVAAIPPAPTPAPAAAPGA